MDKYGRREVIDNDWLIREVCVCFGLFRHFHFFGICPNAFLTARLSFGYRVAVGGGLA